ncbi:MAG TPA: two-component regulator propeller domain-containing protein, partial [Chitinispirillaceae bacterium]|nr:two-component regulator propeller domain-containing protein [Chitinispirillaceae bacterium]
MIGKKRFISFSKIVSSTALFCLILSGQVLAGVGESAVITLIFPPGARSTGFAESFTGLADDATATYYNPAGLGQSPQANSWKSYFHNDGQKFTAISSKRKKEFASKSKIWAGTNTGLMRFNGKAWETYESYLVEEGDDLDRIVSKFINVDDKDLRENALWQIKVENEIGMQRFALLKSSITETLKNNNTEKPDSIAELHARQISNLASFERSVGKIFTIISDIVKDSTQANDLANTLDSHFLTSDVDFKDKHEIKVPFSIAISETVTSLAIDESDRLWVGTENGLWRYNENEWTLYTMLDGLPSNKITAITTGSYGEIAVGTDKGIALYNSGQWTKYDTSDGIPESYITSLAFGSGKEIYAGTGSGLVKIIDSSVTLFDTSDGLLSSNITSLFFDSQKRLWIGSPNGITINSSTSWKRYKFPNTIVTSIAEQKNGNIWLGTNNGAISYQEKRERKDKHGNIEQRAPTWKVFHSKNALTDDRISAMATENNDVWIATETAINRYDYAEKQAMIAFEPLLPAFGIKDLWHLYGAFVFPTTDWGTIGLSINYINMGENEMYNALGRVTGKVRSWEGIFGLSFGLPIKDDFSLGINAKYIISALAPGYN